MADRNYLNAVTPTSLTDDIDDNDTTIPVASNAGFPTPPYTISLDRGESGGPDEEACLVTAHASNSMTVVRGYDGTSASSHSSGAPIEHVVVSLDYEDANAHIYNTGLDQHSQYLNGTRHDARDHTAVLAAQGLAFPIASLLHYARGATQPTGWLVCNGQAVSRATYAALFAVIGTTFGSGDGSTTFNVPDARGRVLIGLDNLGASQAWDNGSANRITDSAADSLGGTGGAEEIVLTSAQMPTHTHVQNAHTHTSPGHTHNGETAQGGSHQHGSGAGTQFVRLGGSGGALSIGSTHSVSELTALSGSHLHAISVFSTAVSINSTTPTNQNSGGGQAHPNTQPWLGVALLIRAV
jgi:microcystin-dependent protein